MRPQMRLRLRPRSCGASREEEEEEFKLAVAPVPMCLGAYSIGTGHTHCPDCFPAGMHQFEAGRVNKREKGREIDTIRQ